MADSSRKTWMLLAGFVYPPPFIESARELGLRPPAFGTLRMLDEPRTMSEIATALNCDNSNVTGIVDVLEEKGLAIRRPSANDRRVKLIELTEEGRDVRARLMDAVETPPAWIETMPEVDRRALRQLLERARERVG